MTVTSPEPFHRAASSAEAPAITRRPRSRSSASTMAFRVVERGRTDDRLPSIDFDAVDERRSFLPPEQHDLAQDWRIPAARHVPDDLATRPDRRAFRGSWAGHREPVEPTVVGKRGCSLQRRPAEEPGLVHPDRPVHAEPTRRGVELGVHADDHVSLLEAEALKCLETMRPDAHPLSQFEEPAPQLDRPVDGMVEFERRLAGE